MGKIAGIWVESIIQEITRRGIKDYLDDNVRFWFAPGYDPTADNDACFCSLSQRSASSAAAQPDPAAVTAWR